VDRLACLTHSGVGECEVGFGSQRQICFRRKTKDFAGVTSRPIPSSFGGHRFAGMTRLYTGYFHYHAPRGVSRVFGTTVGLNQGRRTPHEVELKLLT